jgi:hypothetical protein
VYLWVSLIGPELWRYARVDQSVRTNVVAAADDSLMMIFLVCRSKLMVANRPRACRATRCYSGTTDGDDRPSRIALPSWSVMPRCVSGL